MDKYREVIVSFFLLFLCLSGSWVKAQEWAPFQPAQKSLYYMDSVGAYVYTVEIDSLSESRYFFNRKAEPDIPQAAFNEGMNTVEYYLMFHSVDMLGDSALWRISSNDSILINYRCDPGDSWTFSDITYTCLTTTEMSVLGISDSVKEISATNMLFPDSGPFTFLLSKNVGLVRFPHPYQLFNVPGFNMTVPVELKGYTYDGVQVGNQLTKWDDYMPLQMGDMLTWKITTTDGFSGSTVKFKQQFILVSEQLGDTLQIQATDKITLSDGSMYLTDPYMQTLVKGMIEPILLADSEFPLCSTWPYNYNTDEMEVFRMAERTLDGVADGKVFSTIRVYDAGEYIDTVLGVFGQYTDTERHYTYSTLPGKVAFDDYEFGGSYHEELIGFQIGDSVWGAVDLPLGIEEISLEHFFLFPNPARDFVQLSIDVVPQSVTTFSISGKQIEVEFWQGKADISALPAGFYCTTIQTNDGLLRQKWLKL